MNIGFMRDVRLTRAKETFLMDCQAARLNRRVLRGYRVVLTSFIHFTSDITVGELTPDHVRLYIADLSDRPGCQSLARHYAIIRSWIRWLYAQKIITERTADNVKLPRFKEFSTGSLTICLWRRYYSSSGRGILSSNCIAD